MQCIYCLEDKDPQSFLKTEHVMPQSFGRFKDNLTLNGPNHPQLVCDCCNQYFGNNLEIKLARDTFESVYRYKLGIKEPEEFKSEGKRSRITIRVAEGEFKGAYTYLGYSEQQRKIVLKPVPQIGFRKKDSVVSLDSVYEIRTTRACSLYTPDAWDTIYLRSAPPAPVVRGWRPAVRASKSRNTLPRCAS